MRRALALLAALTLSGAAAAADTVSPAPQAVIVTIYHDDELATSDLLHVDTHAWLVDQGLALITETREVDLPAGPSTIRFRGVASTMVPQTASIDGLPADALERNFDYDLLSPGSLLAKSIGATVHLVRTDPKTGKRTELPAIVRSGPGGAMLEVDGKLEALRCSGLPEALVFDHAPDGLTDTPTLTIKTDAATAGHYTLVLSYLATGLNWSADYVARVHADKGTLDLSGWLTLANFGATGFARVPISAVAGQLNTTGGDKPVHARAVRLASQCWPTAIDWATHHYPPPPPPPPTAGMVMASPLTAVGQDEDRFETVVVTGSRIPQARQLGDYQVYDLPEPTDMPARETKQIQFLDQRDVPFTRVYRFDLEESSNETSGTAALVLELDNTQARGLGKPLPAGAIAITEPAPDGTPIYVGAADVHDTPVGLLFEIAGNETVSVPVRQIMIGETKTGSGKDASTRRNYAVEIGNTRPRAVVVELRASLDDGQTTIVSEGQPHAVERGYAVWRLTVKPGERAQFSYGAQTRE